MARDYYEVLGIEKSAGIEEIKRTYKKLAFEYHPDRNPEDGAALERFKELNEAYQILSDENKRAQYDSFGHISADEMFSQNGGFGANINDLFGNLFEEVFSGGFGSNVQKGNDLKYELKIKFEDAAFGIEEEIIVPKRVACSNCEGSGAAAGGEIRCNVCKGRGSVDYAKGFFAISQTCGQCRGRGYVITEFCDECEGAGLIKTERKVKVNIPAGISDGSRLRIREEGETGLGGAPNGDLFIIVFVDEHPIFKRENNNIFCEVPVNFIQAMIGGEIFVPTLGGKDKIKLPPGTQHGQPFRLKGKGLVDIQTGRLGDLIIIINVEIPKKINSKQKKLLQEFEKEFKPDQLKNIDDFNKTIDSYFKD
ncbi:MAG: molecular chaperone DnaJ [Thermodesulfobacteriota bacterium]